jgi:hypothetical protein
MLVAMEVEDLRARFSCEEDSGAGVPWPVAGDDAGVELTGRGPGHFDG